MIKPAKFKKPAIFFILSASFILAALFALKIFFAFIVDKNSTRSLITSFCKDNFGKAVVFDDVKISAFGNIIINNFNLSVTGDFNDNISLIKASEAVFRMDFFKLLKRDFIIKRIDFITADISLRKSFGKTYSENFKEIINMPEGFKSPKQFDYDDIIIAFKNARLLYTEFFNEKKFELIWENISASFKRKENTIFYALNGRAFNSNGGKLSIVGSIFLEEDRRSSHRIRMNGFALSPINDYIVENGSNFIFHGKISSDLRIVTHGSLRTLKGKLKTHELSIKGFDEEEKHSLISGGNFEVNVDILNDTRKQILDIKNFSLSDKNINMHFAAKNLEREKIFSLDFVLTKLNLSKLSEYVTPLEGVTYSGETSFNCKLHIDANNDAASSVSALGYLNNFTMSGAELEPYRISEGCFNFEIKDRQLELASSFVLSGSDIAVNLKSSIDKFIPLKSASDLEIRSKKFAAFILKDLALLGISSLYDAAYKDKRGYYSNVSFLTNPVAPLIRNNNIKIDWRSEKITFGKAAMSEFALAASLSNGVAGINKFELNGYGGQYDLDFTGFLNRDYPYFKLRCGVVNLNLDEFSSDLGEVYSLGGIINIKCEYGVGAARMSHILQNTTASASFGLSRGHIKGLPVQRRFNEWLHRNGHTGINLNDVFVNSFEVNFTQNADKYSFRRFYLSADSIDFSGYGGYDYQTGALVPLNMTLRDKTGSRRGGAQIFFAGGLMSPRLSFNKKGSEPLLLFNDVK